MLISGPPVKAYGSKKYYCWVWVRPNSLTSRTACFGDLHHHDLKVSLKTSRNKIHAERLDLSSSPLPCKTFHSLSHYGICKNTVWEQWCINELFKFCSKSPWSCVQLLNALEVSPRRQIIADKGCNVNQVLLTTKSHTTAFIKYQTVHFNKFDLVNNSQHRIYRPLVQKAFFSLKKINQTPK